MTVQSTDARNEYIGDGLVSVFPVTFQFLEDSHLGVYQLDNANIETKLTLTSDYTVTGAGVPTGGEITLVAGPLTSGYKLVIIRDVPFDQQTDYIENDNFPAESHETALDKLTMIAQQQQEELNRSLTGRVTGGTLEETGNKFFVDYNENDQGATGSGSSLKDFLDTITVGQNSTIVFLHNSNSVETIYNFSTDVIVPNYVTLDLEPGAVLKRDTGNPSLTINGKVSAGNHKIFNWGGTGKPRFGSNPGDFVNAMWFTGITDGVTSNNADFQLGIDSCPTRGARYYVPAQANRYVLENIEIYRPITIFGDGRGSAIMASSTATGYMITIDGLNPNVVRDEDGAQFGQLENITLRDLWLHGNKRVPDIGAIYSDNCEYVTVKDTHIVQFQRESFKFRSVRESLIENVRTEYCGNRTGEKLGYPDVNLDDDDTGNDTNNGIMFTNFWSVYPLGDHIWLDTAGGAVNNVRHITFSSCFIHGLIPAIDGPGNNPMNLTFTTQQKAQKHFDLRSCDYITINACDFISGGVEQNIVHMLTGLNGSPNFIRISECSFSGRYSYATGGSAVNDIIINVENGILLLSGSYLGGSGTSGASMLTVGAGGVLFISSDNLLSGEGPNYSGNVNNGVAELADEATPSVAGKHVFKTTGTTPITDFNGGYAGQVITIECNTNLTFDFTGGSLIGSTVDITVAPNDTIQFVLDQSNFWRLLGWIDSSVDNS